MAASTTVNATSSLNAGSTVFSVPRAVASSRSSASDLSRSISTWHSGSPNRTLYSISLGPFDVTMMPANSTPVNGVPRSAMRRIEGRIISFSTRAVTSRVITGAGE